MTSYFNLLKYAATGIASPDMTYYDKMRASTLMGGVVQTLTGQPPLTFKADGSPITVWSMKGNGQQTGTPTPDNPVMPEFVGTLDNTDWKIPITCAGQTVPVYLGTVQTVRKIRKLVLTGEESNWGTYTVQDGSYCAFLPLQNFMGATSSATPALLICTHYSSRAQNSIYNGVSKTCCGGRTNQGLLIRDENITSETDFKSYLAAQYANGTPVTIWYVLAEPTTGIVNEPLCKIGDYADELSSEDAGVTIQTVKGSNVLTVDTPIQPSEMTITFKG